MLGSEVINVDEFYIGNPYIHSLMRWQGQPIVRFYIVVDQSVCI